ncbi:hypothetical protein MJN51_37290, partial [Salmonella enterica subsp. enterica serovar Kentucky]|nr:hypothetical protein [Salmonella enterica subsp. enterica serovar Kentucky]
LSQVRQYADNLRAVQHEHRNLISTIAGLLFLKRYDNALALIQLSIWKKAAFNSVMNTYCALLDCNVGGFGQRPGALDLAQAVVD